MAMFNPYNNFYMQDLQNMRDRIDKTMQTYQNQYMQPQQQAPITQNFQITPQQNQNELQSSYVNSIDEVKNIFVIKHGIFITRDLSTLWFKDVTGNIKTYKMEEVIEMDEKDKKILEQDTTILNLQKQINELKGVIANAAEYNNAIVNESVTTKKSTKISNDSKSNAK